MEFSSTDEVSQSNDQIVCNGATIVYGSQDYPEYPEYLESEDNMAPASPKGYETTTLHYLPQQQQHQYLNYEPQLNSTQCQNNYFSTDSTYTRGWEYPRSYAFLSEAGSRQWQYTSSYELHRQPAIGGLTSPSNNEPMKQFMKSNSMSAGI